ncbi:cytochrome b [Alsobacter sp. R-9]
MALATSDPAVRGYSAPARALHWLAALFVAILVPVGLAMTRTPEGALTNALYEIHKSFGILIFVVMIARTALRLVLGAPPPAPRLTRFELVLSKAVHIALYVLLLGMPISGFIGVSMCCAPVNLFWTWPVPIQFSGSEATVKQILGMHEIAGYLLIGLFILHMAGVIQHAMIRKDGVLARMWPIR